MGTSIPPEPRWSADAAPAEQLLWGWAVEQLDDRVLVLPQVAMTVTDRGRPDEAELDLVLIDPEHGVTVVEVKGGTISYDAPRARWLQNGHEVRDPVNQAKRGRSILEKALHKSSAEAGRIALRWAVAVPECRLEAPGEPVLDRSQLWDALAIDQLQTLLRRTCGELTLGEEPLGEELADYLAEYLRGRTREGRPALSSTVAEHEEQVRLHTESHRNVLAHFNAHANVLVRGAAGTGKTILALEAAAGAASWGRRVVLLCWNVVLASWLKVALRAELQALGSPVADEVTDDPTGKVVVSHVAGLAEATVGALPDLPLEELYHEWLPARFGDLSPGATEGEFDVVVLDEAQDLNEAWVLAVAALVAKDGKWFAFSDRQQDLFDNHAALPDFLEVQHELRENFRNSRQIAEFASRFGDIEMDCVTGEGSPIQFVPTRSDRVIARATEVAKKLERDERIPASDLAVLYLFHNPHQHHSDEVARSAMEGELVRTNGAAFKGMERPVIVLGLDMDPTKTERVDEVRRSIYAAATRARSYLVVVGDPDVAELYGFDQLARDLRATTTS